MKPTVQRSVTVWTSAVAAVAALMFVGAASSAAATGTGATVVRLHASTLSAVSGQHITFYTTVAPAVTGGAAPTGTVTFGGAITPAVTVALVKNITTGKQEAKTVAGFAPGGYTVTATYNGDAAYAAHAPISVSVTVTKASTTTTVTAVQSTTHPGHWTITAKVRPVAPGRGTATGPVVFTVDNVAGSPAPLNTSANAYLHKIFAKGTSHTITVNYPGDAHMNASQGKITFTA
jgi:hypothetical protein